MKILVLILAQMAAVISSNNPMTTKYVHWEKTVIIPSSFFDTFRAAPMTKETVEKPDLGWNLPLPSCMANDLSAKDHIGVVLSENPTRTKLTLTFPKDHMIEIKCQGRAKK